MGSQTLGRDNSLSLPSRRVSGVPPWTERWPHDRKVRNPLAPLVFFFVVK